MGNNLRVMLVDDHRLIRMGLSSLLENYEDIEIIGEASDGIEAIDLAQKIHPDVILMDISMPKMNGIEASRIIASELPGTRIIGLSMHDDASTVDAILAAGMEAFVAKGASVDVIVAAIRNPEIN